MAAETQGRNTGKRLFRFGLTAFLFGSTPKMMSDFAAWMLWQPTQLSPSCAPAAKANAGTTRAKIAIAEKS